MIKARLGYVMLVTAKIDVIFGISTSNYARINIICAEKQVVLHSLTFTRARLIQQFFYKSYRGVKLFRCRFFELEMHNKLALY